MKPDLSCTIDAVGPDGRPIGDGELVTYDAGDPGVRINFTVANPSEARSGQFWLRPCVRVDGNKAYDPPVEMINLEPGEAWTDEFNQPFRGSDEEWEVSILVDINDFVDEANERNNRAALAFHARPSTG